MAWATLAQFKTNQPNLASTGDTIIPTSLNYAGSQIMGCLYKGGYNVSALETAIAAGAVYDLLVLLNIRLAALDLMDGGGTSSFQGAQENTYTRWRDWCEKTLEMICTGNAALTNSGTGDDVAPPAYERVGIVSDSRETGIDILIDPLSWPEGDTLNSDLSGLEDD